MMTEGVATEGVVMEGEREGVVEKGSGRVL